MIMDDVVKDILGKVANMHGTPSGAYNIRLNGKSIGMACSPGVTISFKENSSGIEVHVRPGLKGESVHIPVIVESSGLQDVVTNDFYIGDGCEDIHIIAGCGIHNSGHAESRHDGIHTFHVGKNAKVKYSETHYGSGEGRGGRVLNPVTRVILDSGSRLEMESIQIEGVDSTNRITTARLGESSTFIVTEKILTSGEQWARTEFKVDLDGKGSSANVISRSVAKGNSRQEFISQMNGNNECAGHSECDAILMDNGVVKAAPEITASHLGASLIHEAAIGKIAGEQIVKLLTLGLTPEEAEAQIINGFLK